MGITQSKVFLLAWSIALCLGCGDSGSDGQAAKKSAPAGTSPKTQRTAPPVRRPDRQDAPGADADRPFAELWKGEQKEDSPSVEPPAEEPPPSLAPTRTIDDVRAKAAGIRKLAGKRLTLYTDLPASPAVDELPSAFDQAFDQWCRYFGISPAAYADWHMHGFLIKDKSRFEQTELLPRDLPLFLNGYTRGHEFWIFDQASDYYRRHLLLHEGTHGFMFTVLGGCGPPWYMEGLAELLATHSWQDGKLTLGRFPRSADEVPRLGRIEIVQAGIAAGQGKQLVDVLGYDARAHLRNEPYGWCWAAAAFLDGHPRYQQRFRQLHELRDTGFNQTFMERYREDWPDLSAEWNAFVFDLTYGHDLQRTVIDFAPAKPLTAPAKINVAADRGWQNSGLELEAGKTYAFEASGRYQLAQNPTWWSEPNGVSIRYHHGQPLGLLVAAVHPRQPERSQPSEFIRPIPIGLRAGLTPLQSGTLLLRINDSAAELADNAGSLQVTISSK